PAPYLYTLSLHDALPIFSLAILKEPGFPTTSDPCGKIFFGRKAGSNEFVTLGRMDYQKSDKHSIFGRYMMARYDQPSDFDAANLLALSNAELRFRVQSFVLGDTYVIGNGTVSNFRATVNRSKIPKSSPQYFDPNDVGINMFVYVPEFMRFTVTGGFNIAGTGATP